MVADGRKGSQEGREGILLFYYISLFATMERGDETDVDDVRLGFLSCCEFRRLYYLAVQVVLDLINHHAYTQADISVC